jgi:hypothetical protein
MVAKEEFGSHCSYQSMFSDWNHLESFENMMLGAYLK